MSEEPAARMGGGLVYSDSVPLAWRDLKQMPDEQALARISETSQQVLRLILSIEEQHADLTEEGDLQREDIARLEFKLNLLVDLVGQLLARQAIIPAPLAMSLNAHGIEWTADDAPRQNSYIEVELYLSPRYPRPVVLPGFVESVNEVPEGTRTQVIFPEFSEPLQDALEKFIFRRHRRTVANPRRLVAKAESL